MEQRKEKITVQVEVDSLPAVVWKYWTEPGHIVRWYVASDNWHTSAAVNDLRQGGWFRWRMEAKDGSAGFDFEGRYDEVVPGEKIVYSLADGRRVRILFAKAGNYTRVTEAFDTEDQNPAEMQRAGWQAILDRFKYYVESGEKQGFVI